MIFYSVPDLRLRKRQVKHVGVIKARSGMQPIHFPPIKPKIILHCKSRPTPHATSPQKEFSTSCSIKTSRPTGGKIITYQWGTILHWYQRNLAPTGTMQCLIILFHFNFTLTRINNFSRVSGELENVCCKLKRMYHSRNYYLWHGVYTCNATAEKQIPSNWMERCSLQKLIYII